MFEFKSFNSDKKIQLENCPLCNSEDLKVSHIGNEHTKKRSIEIKCKNCRINIKDSALRNGFDWLEDLSANNWNDRQASTIKQLEARCKELEKEKGLYKNTLMSLKVVDSKSSEGRQMIDITLSKFKQD